MSQASQRVQRKKYSSQPQSESAGRRNVGFSQPGPSFQDDFSQSFDATQSSSQVAKGSLPQDEENHLVATVVKYLLAADHPKTMIQRTNIIKNAMPDHGKYFKYIMKKVQETMKEIFGYNLVELEGNKYILTNNIPNTNLQLQFSKSDKAELILLFIALSHIFMIEDNGCTEDELFDLFRQLDIVEDNNFIHDYFGDVKHLITEKFVKQGYLQLVNVNRADPPVSQYQWGPRAKNELRPRTVLEFMSKIFGGRPLNTWPTQFNRMQEQEGLSSTS